MHVFLFSLFKSGRLFLISVACITLAACGGGGGSSDSPTPVITPEPTPTPVVVVTPEPTSTPVPVLSDTSPDIFTLSVESGAELHEEFTANVTVSGIDTETAITISGTGGEYKIDDGDYTIATGTVVNGQTVTVKATAADTYATLREITLTIGDQSDVFSVTTRNAVITPADFEFTATTDAEPGSVNESNSISVAGIEISVAISITGGEYSIDGSDFTSEQGSIGPENATVVVRGTASDLYGTQTEVVLTIGENVSDTFTITTIADTTAPTATIAFPPPASMTEGDSVFIRGTVEDDLSGVATVFVDVAGVMTEATITETDGVYAWQTTVALTEGDNVVRVIATDVSGNEIAEADISRVNVKRDTDYGDFPDSENGFSFARSVAVDFETNRIFVSDFDLYVIYTVDMATGARTLFYDTSFEDVTRPIEEAAGFLINEEARTMWVTDQSFFGVHLMDMDTGEQQLVATEDFPIGQIDMRVASNPINDPTDTTRIIFGGADIFSMDTSEGSLGNRVQLNSISVGVVRSIGYNSHDPEMENKIYFSDNSPFRIGILDLDTGSEDEIIKSGDSNDFIFSSLSSLNYYLPENKLIATDWINGNIFNVFLPDGEITTFSGSGVPDNINLLMKPQSSFYDERLGYLLTSDQDADALFAIDITTGYRVVVSKATAP